MGDDQDADNVSVEDTPFNKEVVDLYRENQPHDGRENETED